MERTCVHVEMDKRKKKVTFKTKERIKEDSPMEEKYSGTEEDADVSSEGEEMAGLEDKKRLVLQQTVNNNKKKKSGGFQSMGVCI